MEKRSGSTLEFGNETRSDNSLYGNDRFWTRQNFPGFPGLGTSDSRAVWKGPIRASTVA